MLKLVEGENGAIRVEVDWLKEKGETMEAKYKGAEQENSQLKREIEELWASFTGQKKEVEELQEGFAARKKSWRLGLLLRGRSWKRSIRSKWTKCTFSATAAV